MLFSQIRQYVKGVLANSFINKSTLDKLGENNNGLTFDGNNIEPPQKLTAAQMQEIKDAFVVDNPRNGYPVLFDETGAEHFVGWYKYANGTKKPVYEKTINDNSSHSFSANTITDIPYSISDLDHIISCWGTFRGDPLPTSSFSGSTMNYHGEVMDDTNGIMFRLYRNGSAFTGSGIVITVRYTKTTDTPQ